MPVMTAPESALEELLAEAKVMSRKFVDLELKFQNQLSNEKRAPGCLRYIGDYTTQV